MGPDRHSNIVGTAATGLSEEVANEGEVPAKASARMDTVPVGINCGNHVSRGGAEGDVNGHTPRAGLLIGQRICGKCSQGTGSSGIAGQQPA